MKYYRMMDDLNLSDRWFLNGLNVVEKKQVSVWSFLTPKRLQLDDNISLEMGIRSHGQPLDFTFADFELPVVNQKVSEFFSESECQFFPIKITLASQTKLYFVMIILNAIDCLDEERSVFEKWLPDNQIRPDLAGEYKNIYKMYVDQRKIEKSRIFRLSGYDSAIIVNDEIKDYFQAQHISGVKFREVI